MTHIYDDPSDFKEQVIEGFAAAYGRYVERVPGASGFIRRGGPRAGKVSLVVGGGSGHYPSYSGTVGPGFADGCVLGDVFTSPSTEQVVRIARAADGGAGVILSYGNYAGDRLNFGGAQERLRAAGIDCRNVYVTDDIASAGPDEADRRRGIAGTFLVYKIGGAAADSGCDVDTVERVMRAANAATFSFGVAFGGCTLPGRAEPLFSVEKNQMEFGLGIHGEPGIRTGEWMPARELAQALVDAVLAERPAGAGGRAAVILNGLGSTKYEELFVLYGHVQRLLTAAGVEPVLPEVGELVTSLDMAGCSLSLTWLDDELERYWLAPADTAAFRRGETSTLPTYARRTDVAEQEVTDERPAEASPVSRAAAGVARRAIAAMTAVVAENEENLGRIDAVAGDGDHGIGMVRGLRAAQAAAEAADGGVGDVLTVAGDAFGDKAGGTSGLLWGVGLAAVGAVLGNTDEVTPALLRDAVHAGAAAIQRVGKAERGDKTMLDALLPFAEELDRQLGAGLNLSDAWRVAAAAAVEAGAATASLRARVGRARPLAERGVGTPDAGAVSMGLILTAVGEVLAQADCVSGPAFVVSHQPTAAAHSGVPADSTLADLPPADLNQGEAR
ncbi:dihydroxyacetone kinase family protein [Sphaerisporangium sp. NPDC051011]|uniref:dihydroxyacetone kinase family protein n=1 Tax=Sphaerisporangium sp. NPDC051011 TaxID=3155792 RepID=UPI00340DA438